MERFGAPLTPDDLARTIVGRRAWRAGAGGEHRRRERKGDRAAVSADGQSPPPELGQARARFLELVAEIRPELHRYCARLTGSVIEGEDIVQDTLAKAYYAISMAHEMPPLRPFLFRIAHNTAMDVLRRYERKHVELVAEIPDDITVDERPDPEVMRAALATFLELPIAQRSAVILKDVLGCSLEEIVESTGASLPGGQGGAPSRPGGAARAGRAVVASFRAAAEGSGGAGRGARAPPPLRDALQRARLGGAAPVHRRGLPARSRVARRTARPGGGRVLHALRGAARLSGGPRRARRRRDRRPSGAGHVLAARQPAPQHLRAPRMARRADRADSRLSVRARTSPTRCCTAAPRSAPTRMQGRAHEQDQGNGRPPTSPGNSRRRRGPRSTRRTSTRRPTRPRWSFRSERRSFAITCAAIDDLHAMLKKSDDWVPLGSADEQKPAAPGSVEDWGRAASNPVKGWYGLKKGLRGRFGTATSPPCWRRWAWPRSSTIPRTTGCAPPNQVDRLERCWTSGQFVGAEPSPHVDSCCGRPRCARSTRGEKLGCKAFRGC